MQTRHDLVVIGTGTAAMTAAMRVRAVGWSVAVIDVRPFGGTCALRGCDPKKLLVGGATAIDHARRMQGKGVSGDVHIHWPDLMAFKRGFTDPVSAKLNAPGGVAVAPHGDLFVADFYNQRVQQLKADGSFVRQWGSTGKIGVRAGEFNYPTDVALDSNGVLYVADGYNDRIQVFGRDGKLLRKWGGPYAMNIFGPFNGWFATVTRVTVDNSDKVFVADFYNHRIQKFTADGEFLTSFGAKGAGPGQFNHAIAVAAAEDGTVFAVDFGNNRIQKWRRASRAGQ
jgi:DNA-binding beta-propeller fold protein YncE